MPKTVRHTGIQGLPRPSSVGHGFAYATADEARAVRERDRQRLTARLAREQYWRHDWQPRDFQRQTIPVAYTSGLVARSGLAAPYTQAVTATLREAAGGKLRGLISPRQVLDAGMRLGVGYLIGRPAMTVLSKTLGGVAGLNRGAQEKLTRWGTLGIMLGNTFLGRAS